MASISIIRDIRGFCFRNPEVAAVVGVGRSGDGVDSLLTTGPRAACLCRFAAIAGSPRRQAEVG
jgi:hypothetical protein